jgi:hypothetical protein
MNIATVAPTIDAAATLAAGASRSGADDSS